VIERTGGANAPSRWDVLVIGGGAAGLTAAIAARHRGCSVLLLDAASYDRPGGNARHASCTRLPTAPGRSPVPGDLDRFEDELVQLGASTLYEPLLQATTLGATELASFMSAHGVRFQGPYVGVVDPEESTHFLIGGGLALVRSYRRHAARLGVVSASDARVVALCPAPSGNALDAVIAQVAGRTEQIDARAFVIASGGAEARGDSGVPNAVVHGGAENDGAIFALFAELDAASIGEGADFVAVDQRSPSFDGGTATTIDGAGFGVVVDSSGRLLPTSGERPRSKAGREFGAAVARTSDGRAIVCWDKGGEGAFIPSCWPPEQAATRQGLARVLGVDEREFESSTRALWNPPFFGVWVRPGVTGTRRSFLVDEGAGIVRGDGSVFENVFAAGESMAGSIRPHGSYDGLSITIAGVWGRIAARSGADVP
jgi:tricarballylate dehydrogenase